jgi:membrane-bound inhibitor of C-type lysozyme
MILHRTAVTIGLAVSAGAAFAAPDVVTASYTCERGVRVPVTYVNAAEGSVAILTVEGRQITLFQTEAASGARYAWPSGGSGYVWWTKADEADLLWSDGASGEETPLLSDCRSG